MGKKGETDYQAKPDKEYERWNDIAVNGCSDPFWTDGVNMNLVRNHILYYRGILSEKKEQTSLFDQSDDPRPVPEKVSNMTMIRGGKWQDRIDKLFDTRDGTDKVVWIESGVLVI